MSLGSYPPISLKEARTRSDEARALDADLFGKVTEIQTAVAVGLRAFFLRPVSAGDLKGFSGRLFLMLSRLDQTQRLSAAWCSLMG